MALNLQIVICSTRPGRVGPSVAKWFDEFAKSHSEFRVKCVDLADFDLPIYNEAKHPRLKDYEFEATNNWSRSVDKADAYVFVTPEYNFGATPALINALNYVYQEWNYKPCGFVSYGGMSGGVRGVQVAKQLVTTLKMMPMVEGVAIPNVANQLDDDQKFLSNELIDDSARSLLDELHKWAVALKPMRQA